MPCRQPSGGAIGRRSALRLILPVAAVASLASARTEAAGSAVALQGQGVQIYACEQVSGAFRWNLRAPEATLHDSGGAVVGRHFAGPTWQASDGSTVVGEAVASSPAPGMAAVPWLVLRAKAHAGEGAFASVAYVVRADTKGGLAPAAGCDQARAGAESRVPYSATYIFFPAG